MSMESTGVQVKVESKVSSCIYMYLGVSYDEVPWVSRVTVDTVLGTSRSCKTNRKCDNAVVDIMVQILFFP